MNSKLALTLILSLTFFEYGCTTAQRKEILDEAKAYTVEHGKELAKAAISAATSAAKEYVDAELAKREQAELKELDAHLALHKVTDAEGNESVKTWKDFDADKSGDLGDSELAKVAAFLTTQTARKVAAGEMSKDEAGKHAKSAGITLAALMAILLGKRAVTSMTKKSTPPGEPAAPPSGRSGRS